MRMPSSLKLKLSAAAFVAGLSLAAPAAAQSGAVTLFNNVRVFDGKGAALSAPTNVLVRGSIIEKISSAPIPTDRRADTVIVEGGGRTLMPGLIDAHVHMVMTTVPIAVAMMADPSYATVRATRTAQDMLMRGFTSVRDLGGPSFGLKRAIDEGFVSGPRIWPAGAMIAQTSGHGDFRTMNDIPRGSGDPLHFTERLGYAAIADGTGELLRRTREQLMRGASQIKITAGGGVASDHSPLDVSLFTEEEIKAVVDATTSFGTYVTAHAYTPDSIKRVIRAGAKCIEHGHLADEEAARLMADKGVWWSMQPFLDDEDMIPLPEGSPNRIKQLEVVAGTERAYNLAKTYKVKLAWGTDTLFDARLATRQGAQLAKMTKWFTPAETLRMATADNAELLALSGLRSPYPGKLGVVEEGALADLLLVDGDPIANIKLIENPEKNFMVIMKDGKLYKNTVPRG